MPLREEPDLLSWLEETGRLVNEKDGDSQEISTIEEEELYRRSEYELLLRENNSKIIHSVVSEDQGKSWSKPKKTNIEGYPADLLILQEDVLACVTGNRNKPYQILMYISDDFGETWRNKIIISDNLINQDLGYPTIAQRKNGEIVIIYYTQNNQYVTSIHQKVVIIE